MTVSTNAQICYGVLFEEGYAFPWDAEKWDGNVDKWWLYDVCGYVNPFELYDESGNYINGVEPSKEKIDQYHTAYRIFEKDHPLPVKLVNCCSGNYPIYILAIPESYIVVCRGYPQVISASMLVKDKENRKILLHFCGEYQLEYKSGPAWWLSSYWG